MVFSSRRQPTAIMPLIQIDLPAEKDVILESAAKEAMRSKRSQATIMLIERLDQVEAELAAKAKTEEGA